MKCEEYYDKDMEEYMNEIKLTEWINGYHSTTNTYDIFIYVNSANGNGNSAMVEYADLEKIFKQFTFEREKNNGGKKDRARNIKLKALYEIDKLIIRNCNDIKDNLAVENLTDEEQIVGNDNSSWEEILNYTIGYRDGMMFAKKQIEKWGDCNSDRKDY